MSKEVIKIESPSVKELFIPVSTRIKQSPIQYARSYIYSEQDDNDLTYSKAA